VDMDEFLFGLNKPILAFIREDFEGASDRMELVIVHFPWVCFGSIELNEYAEDDLAVKWDTGEKILHPKDPRMSLIRAREDFYDYGTGKYMFRPGVIIFPQQLEIHSLIYDNHYHEKGIVADLQHMQLNHYWTLSEYFWNLKISRGSPFRETWRKDWGQFERKNSDMVVDNLYLKNLASIGYENGWFKGNTIGEVNEDKKSS